MSRPGRCRVRPRPLRPDEPEDAPPPPKNVVKKSENGLLSPNTSSISSGVIVRKPPRDPLPPPKSAFHWPANGLAPPCASACSYKRQFAPSSSYFLRFDG